MGKKGREGKVDVVDMGGIGRGVNILKTQYMKFSKNKNIT